MVETERRFLVTNMDWVVKARRPMLIEQFYLSQDPLYRLRRVTEGTTSKCIITTKTGRVNGSCIEVESDVTHVFYDAARKSVINPSEIINKTRFHVAVDDFRGSMWEIDVFDGNLNGLIIAEIELDDINDPIYIPPWIGEEITEDHRYSNACLAVNGIPK